VVILVETLLMLLIFPKEAAEVLVVLVYLQLREQPQEVLVVMALMLLVG
jgi:hypothetical protein